MSADDYISDLRMHVPLASLCCSARASASGDLVTGMVGPHVYRCGLEVRMTRLAIVMARKKMRRRIRSITSDTCFHSSENWSLASALASRSPVRWMVLETSLMTRLRWGSEDRGGTSPVRLERSSW